MIPIYDYYPTRVKQQCERFNYIQQESAKGNEQKSKSWLLDKTNAWGSSEVAAILNNNKFKSNKYAILEKSYLTPKFLGNAATLRGEQYEQVIANIFSNKTGYTIYDTTFIKIPEFSNSICEKLNLKQGWNHIGDSSDGQYVKQIYDETIKKHIPQPCVIEIKTLSKNKPIRGFIPSYYKDQIQNHLMVTGYDTCDYIEASFNDYLSENEFMAILSCKKFKHAGVMGAIFSSSKKTKFIYTKIMYDPENPSWLQLAKQNIQVNFSLPKNNAKLSFIYWICTGYYNEIVPRDPNWFIQSVPVLIAAWSEVEFFRTQLHNTIIDKLISINVPNDEIQKILPEIEICYKLHDVTCKLCPNIIILIEYIINELSKKFTSMLDVHYEPIVFNINAILTNNIFN
jgi:hypothetical protein